MVVETHKGVKGQMLHLLLQYAVRTVKRNGVIAPMDRGDGTCRCENAVKWKDHPHVSALSLSQTDDFSVQSLIELGINDGLPGRRQVKDNPSKIQNVIHIKYVILVASLYVETWHRALCFNL